MKNIEILDCTLRDGGYINDFKFGKAGIKKIISQLTSAGVDIIECGFLEDGEYDPDCSVFNTVEQIKEFIPFDRNHSIYVAMACYGEYDISQLTDYDGTSVDGIRVTFHYDEIDDALQYSKKIIDKGYKVFIQPVGTTSYSDEQLIQLIKHVNELQPYSFYLVDTLGLMHQKDLLRFYNLIDHNLNKSIHMGFHSHNNLQLSYSNCQALVHVETDRTISLDASVYGMGRGAGNLNTELIANYLNEHIGRRYEIEPLLEVVDEHIINIKKEHEWGYSVPYYLAAINGCHPNYASYLSQKQTLTVKNIGTILRMIEPENRSLFNKGIAERKYKEFQDHEVNDEESIKRLCAKLSERNIVVLAPGPSLTDSVDRIVAKVSDEKCVVISSSFVPDFIECDYTFLSNKKRYNTTFNPHNKKLCLIHTSNIIVNDVDDIVVNYSSLLNEEDVVMDNSTLMLLNLLTKIKPSKVYLAGFDGYNLNGNNYYQSRLQFSQDKETLMEMNEAISRRVKELHHYLDITFLTKSVYEQ